MPAAHARTRPRRRLRRLVAAAVAPPSVTAVAGAASPTAGVMAGPIAVDRPPVLTYDSGREDATHVGTERSCSTDGALVTGSSVGV